MNNYIYKHPDKIVEEDKISIFARNKEAADYKLGELVRDPKDWTLHKVNGNVVNTSKQSIMQ